VLVKKGATIGANSTIVCGRTVGRYAFIGAGSVLTMNVRDFALVFGNPARQIGWMCRCGVRLELPVSSTHEIEADCRACKSGYVLKGESLFEKTKSNA
ncbi:MAG: N-acetyltransferase, partial [Deltaproteobacteria bacterium]|nr:N-acetyltransferase [Deltaproteobacteria bacterium]